MLTDHFEWKILRIRGHQVMLDTDLAKRKGVPTRTLNQTVKRNSARFPNDFKFQLTAEETAVSRSQIVILQTGRGQHGKPRRIGFKT